MEYQLKADKILIQGEKSASQARLYLASREDELAGGLGRLFIIIEAHSREKKIPQILEQALNELSEYYYHSPTKNVEAALETTAQYFNENIVDISGKNLKWIREKINILMAVVQGNKLTLTAYGDIKLWLFRDDKIHDVTGGITSNEGGSGKKILSQLISGKLNDKDVLLLTNNGIFDYFSDEKIKKTVTTLAPTQACAFFKNTLVDYKINISFASIIVKITAYKSVKNEEQEHVLNKKENGTQYALNELNRSGYGDFLKQRGQALFKAAVVWAQKVINNLKERRQQGRIMAKSEDKDKNNIKKRQAAAGTKSGKKNTDTKEINTPGQGLGSVMEKIKAIKLPHYRLTILIIVVAVLFAASLISIKQQQTRKHRLAKFDQTVQDIKDKIDSVEAALIYKDKDKAQELLAQSRSLMNTLKNELPPEDKERENTYQQLENKIQNQVNKIYRLKNLDGGLVELAKFNITPGSNLFLNNKNVLLLADVNGTLYKLNSQSKKLDKITVIGKPVRKINAWPNKKTVLSGQGNVLWLANESGYQAKKITFDKPNEQSRLVDLSNYGNKIYVLDTANNNIYKYALRHDKFSAPEKWLKQQADLKNARQILVDGNIWVIKDNGEVEKYFRGQKEIFEWHGLYENLGKNIKLWTAADLNALYLIDQDKNRVIITDKDGQVKQQLLGDKVEKILSVIPNNREDELYILTERHIYRYKL